MNLIRTFYIIVLLFVTVIPWGGSVACAQDAPYVGAYEADNFFSTITSNEMNVLRTKKILFVSRSFGLNMRDGLAALAASNSMYNILADYVRYDIPNYTISSIPSNAFSTYNFVHVLGTYWPFTQRLNELDTLLRDAPYSFGSQVDVVMVYYHTANAALFAPYTNMMSQWQADFPNIKFVYVTSGYMSDEFYYSENTNSTAFGNQIRAVVKGQEPVYDLGYILNNDGACGDSYCPEYSTDPAGVHPNAPFAEARMGKAFLLMLRDLYFGSGCTSAVPPTVPGNLSGTALSDTSVALSWDASTHECGVARYELTRNGVALTSTHATDYIDTGLSENTPYNYAVRAVSMAEVASAYSSTSTVTTLADSMPPTVVLAKALSATQVSVEFSENMDPVSSQIATNYTLNYGVSVLSASLSGKTVTLSTTDMADGTNYTVTISHVADASSATNPVAPGTETSFTYVRLAYPEDPTAYWTLDGTLNDSSSNALNGTWVGSSSYGPALLGQGLALSGATNGSYAQVANNALLGGMPQLSISVWAKKNNAAVGGSLFMRSGAYYLTVNDDDLKVNVQAASSITLTPTLMTDINNTNWHHYAVVYNGTNAMVYVDGTQRSSKALAGNILSPAVTMSIGKNTVNTPYATFAGDIDELKIFRRALNTNEISALISSGISGSADRAAVRTILDANNLTNKQVDAISVYQNDRIIKLYMQEAGVSNLTSDIGQLSKLTLLHLYGDRNLGYPLLTQVAPEIGSCSNLTELLLNQNNLTNLPPAITNLTKLTTFSIGDNLLCGSYSWEAWANVYDSDWRATQDCPPAFWYIYSILHGSGSVSPATNILTVAAGQSTQLVYRADAWNKISAFSTGGTSVPAAVGQAAYTAVYANVSADISNDVTFVVITASIDGVTPATWYGPLNANATLSDEDADNLTLAQEYLINSNPTQSNAFQMVSAGLDGTAHVSLSWTSLGLPNGQVQIGLQQDLNGATVYPAGTITYANGVCTWRSDGTVTNDTGFIRLRINSIP